MDANSPPKPRRLDLYLPVRGGQYACSAGWPFDHADTAFIKVIADAHVFQLFRVTQTIKIKVIHPTLRKLVGFHQCISRAFYRPGVAERAQDAPRQRGFSRTE